MNNIIRILPTLVLMLYITSCSKLNDPINLSLEKVIKLRFEVNQDSIMLADNHDQRTVVAYLDSTNVGINQNVTFTTQQGRFVGASVSDQKTITVRADGFKAKAILISDTKTNPKVQLSAKVGEYIVYSSAQYTRSYPETIYTTPSAFEISTTLNSKITLDVNLTKDIGDVSDETPVDFQVINVSGAPKLFVQSLIWSKVSSNNSTEITSVTNDTGHVKIITKVFNGTNYIYGKDTILVHIRN